MREDLELAPRISFIREFTYILNGRHIKFLICSQMITPEGPTFQVLADSVFISFLMEVYWILLRLWLARPW